MKHRNRYLVLVAVQLAAAGGAWADELYFSQTVIGQPARTGIFRVDLATFAMQPVVTGVTGPITLALDLEGERVYWNGVTGVFSARLDGTDVRTVSDGDFTIGLAFDPIHQKVIWSDFNRVMRSNPDGSGREQIATLSFGAQDLLVDPASQKLYVTDYTGANPPNGRLRRMNLDGSGPEIVLDDVPNGPIGVALNPSAGELYVSRFDIQTDDGTLFSANLDGSDLQTIQDAFLPRRLDIDVAGEKLYWNERQDELPMIGAIRRSNLDGTGVETLPIAEHINPSDIVFVPEPQGALLLLAGALFARRAPLTPAKSHA